MIEPVTKDYVHYDDGTMSFLSHHMCNAFYGIPHEASKKKIDYITKLISSNAGEYLTNLIREDSDPFGSDILEIDRVFVSCGISELQPCRHTMFSTYYNKVSYNFIMTLRINVKVPVNLIKLKRPKFFDEVTNNGENLLKEIGMSSPVVFIEEFIFSHEKTNGMFAL